MPLPGVRINMAMTLDGRTMRPEGGWFGLTSDRDRKQMDEYRSQADALIVGKNSVIADDPVVYTGKAVTPTPVLIARSEPPPVDRRIFREAKTTPLLFLGVETIRNKTAPRRFTPEERLMPRHVEAGDGATSFVENLRALCDAAEVYALLPEELEPRAILERLYARGHRRVLLEGGPRLNHAFLADGLVQEFCLTVVPYVIGKRHLPTTVEGPEAIPGFDADSWKLVQSEARGDEVFLRYERVNQ